MRKKEKSTAKIKQLDVNREALHQGSRFSRQSVVPKLMSIAFLSPWIVGFLIFGLIPFLQMIRYSFNSVIFRPTGTVYNFVGWENFRRVLFVDPDFRLQLTSYLRIILLLLPVIMVFSLLLASLLNAIGRGRGVFRAIYFLPVILISGPLLDDLYTIEAFTLAGLNDFFVFRFILDNFPQAFTTNFMFIMDNIVLCLWLSGVQLLIFLSGMQRIDRSLYEAAEVEGASAWQCFWKITIPILKPFILLNAIYTLVDLSTSSLNPIKNIITGSMYQENRGFGYSAAVAWLYLAVELIFIGIILFLLARDHQAHKQLREHKQEERRITYLRKQRSKLRGEA